MPKWWQKIFMKSHQISAHLLVCLVCQETMAVKNFVFRENWIGSKVAGMKQPFLPFLTQPGPTFWPKKAWIRNSLKNILVRKNMNYIIINFVTLRLTNWSEILENNLFFAIFDPNGSKFGPKYPSNMTFLAKFALNFHSGVCTTTTFCFKRYPPCKIWKKTYW